MIGRGLAGLEMVAGAIEEAPRGRGSQGSLGGPGRIECGCDRGGCRPWDLGLEWRGRCLAAVKACGPGAALSHYSAAALWRLVEIDESRPIDVTVPMRGAREIPGVSIHRTRVPFEVVSLDGIPVTTPARALLDFATMAPFDVLRRAVREAMARKRAGVRDLVAVRGRTARRT